MVTVPNPFTAKQSPLPIFMLRTESKQTNEENNFLLVTMCWVAPESITKATESDTLADKEPVYDVIVE